MDGRTGASYDSDIWSAWAMERGDTRVEAVKQAIFEMTGTRTAPLSCRGYLAARSPGLGISMKAKWSIYYSCLSIPWSGLLRRGWWASLPRVGVLPSVTDAQISSVLPTRDVHGSFPGTRVLSESGMNCGGANWRPHRVVTTTHKGPREQLQT